jgi:hypothetical protein
MKDEAARNMATIVLEQSVSRDALAAQHHEGLILALASAVHARPEPGDVDRLLRVADEVNRLHVKYRIVLACGRLAERGFAGPTEIARIRTVFRFYEADADPPLRLRLQQTAALLDDVEARGAFPA